MYFLCDLSAFVNHNYGRYVESCHQHDFRWVKLSGTDLLPGDVVSIGRSSGQNGEDKSVPADLLLLAGSAIVNEAILTGESTPQWKVVSFLFSNKCCFKSF
jgi:P-type E1-E2 ATPase